MDSIHICISFNKSVSTVPSRTSNDKLKTIWGELEIRNGPKHVCRMLYHLRHEQMRLYPVEVLVEGNLETGIPSQPGALTD